MREALLIATFFAFSVSSSRASEQSDIPVPQVKQLLKTAKIQSPWQIDQLATGNDGTTWQVDAYSNPRLLAGSFCSAEVISLDVKKNGAGFKIGEIGAAQRFVALKNCDLASARAGDFHAVTGSFTKKKLSTALQAVVDLVASSGSGKFQIYFENDDLKTALQKTTLRDLSDIDFMTSDSVQFSFLSKDALPDTLKVTMNFSKDRVAEAEVSHGENPDLLDASGR